MARHSMAPPWWLSVRFGNRGYGGKILCDADATVPLAWSLDFCERLQTLGKDVECFTYSGLPHTFRGAGDTLFMERYIAFFDRYLK